ncbi:MAG: hypothetical protein QGF59_05425, partial [Pirellulaceae bacterium]|nr:hypothetical protein [Pirellulaceae bacterium]
NRVLLASSRAIVVLAAIATTIGRPSTQAARLAPPEPKVEDPARLAPPEPKTESPPITAPPEPAVEKDAPAGHSQHGEAFNEGPRQKAYLMGGTGAVRFDVTTCKRRSKPLALESEVRVKP